MATLLKSSSLHKNKPDKEPSLPGFEGVNRFWNRSVGGYVAKILPGEFYVTKAHEWIATTLGSCVAACIWDEDNRIGGMNHFMLPVTDQDASQVTWGNAISDATRYGNYAMEHLINELLKNGAIRKNLRVKVCGGGKVLQQQNNVGARNAEFVLTYLDQENIRVVSQDLGDIYPRKVMFDPLTGKARIKKIANLNNDTIVKRERSYQQTVESAPVEGDVELF